MEAFAVKQVLIVDDAPGLVKGLKRSLEQEGYQVSTAADGLSALEKIGAGSFDAILLDLMLPEMDGLTVCREVRQRSSVPIIMLTAKNDDIDKILGLEIGADDYITKPFNTKELIARLRALFRRVDALRRPHDEETIRIGALAVHRASHRVEVAGRSVLLTAREFHLLETMAAHPGMIYTRQQLLDLVWGYEFAGDDRTVDAFVRRLREKVEPDPAAPQFIKTMRGVGYYLEAQR
ncbi:MAG: two-component response regulator [Symbiobacteriaceae bacterium]|jgi:DNA-binding response OmpR family regulator|nr:two-component response regulator [Symbiobacteriaceae bacterium]